MITVTALQIKCDSSVTEAIRTAVLFLISGVIQVYGSHQCVVTLGPWTLFSFFP